MSNKNIVAIYGDTITQDEINKIKEKHTGLVHDFSNEEEFKAARKVRTEMNKILDAVDRIGIDAAQDITDMRNFLKEEIESAYSGTVAPFLIENQKRLDEAKRVKKEKEERIAQQKTQLDKIKGASARAIHLPIDDIDEILQDIMNIDIDFFDENLKQEAEAAKNISLAQLQDAYKFAQQKDEMRKERELREAELADKDDELEKLKAQLAALQPKEELPKARGLQCKMNDLMYRMTKDAASYSFKEYLEDLDISESDYLEIKKEWSKIGITKTYI